MKFNSILLSVMLIVFSGHTVRAQLNILSGAEQGSYHQFVNDIARAVNSDTLNLITNTSTEGAAINLENIADPASPYKIGLVQEDYLYYMQNKDLIQNTSKLKHVKVVMPLAKEEIHLVTRKDRGINDLRDLTDSTMVAIGKRSQGTYTTANNIKDKTRIFWMSMPVLYEDALRMLLINQLDAFFVVGSAPIEKLNMNPQALSTEIKLVPLVDFDGWAKYYDADVITAGTYKWLEEDVPTFAVQSLLVVNEKKLTDEDKVLLDKLIDGITDNLDKLKSNGHPKWKEVDLTNWDPTDWPVYEK
jgi:TRAP transporter TAXI family solute receptor